MLRETSGCQRSICSWPQSHSVSVGVMGVVTRSSTEACAGTSITNPRRTSGGSAIVLLA